MIGEEVRVDFKEGAEVLNSFGGEVLEYEEGFRGYFL